MKKILLENDILVIDGKEFSYNQLTGYLTERLILKKQLEVVKSIGQGGASEWTPYLLFLHQMTTSTGTQKPQTTNSYPIAN